MARSTVLIALGALLGAAAPAASADLGLPPPPVMEDAPALSELGTGWYLRGDLGYVAFDEPKEDRVRELRRVFGKDRAEEAFSAGFGIGYKFLSVFRADVTADHRFDAGIDEHDSFNLFGNKRLRDESGFESTTLLANGYLDLGTWYGVTPYLGGGVGVAFNRYHGHCRPLAPGVGPCFRNSPDWYVPGRTVHNFAWSLAAGAAIEVGHGFSVDVGYRYVNLGASHSDTTRLGLVTKGEDIEAHEARVGLRFMID